MCTLISSRWTIWGGMLVIERAEGAISVKELRWDTRIRAADRRMWPEKCAGLGTSPSQREGSFSADGLSPAPYSLGAPITHTGRTRIPCSGLTTASKLPLALSDPHPASCTPACPRSGGPRRRTSAGPIRLNRLSQDLQRTDSALSTQDQYSRLTGHTCFSASNLTHTLPLEVLPEVEGKDSLRDSYSIESLGRPQTSTDRRLVG
ncbi:uncharacterized protein LOC122471227 [Prionailurus bengalensis]|uniref:uncharacterized protein LOC122471227 n=1 Tax=Prionailurus bengalensis TaxID=37029 RepID=UPI001CA829C4|nr:uncharacterized protein LOC122471227 [Prionailurus bengalensis]